MKEVGRFKYKGNTYILGTTKMVQEIEIQGNLFHNHWVPRLRLHEAIKKARSKAGVGHARFQIRFSPSKKLLIGCYSFSPTLGKQIAQWAAAGARAYAKRKAKGRR